MKKLSFVKKKGEKERLINTNVKEIDTMTEQKYMLQQFSDYLKQETGVGLSEDKFQEMLQEAYELTKELNVLKADFEAKYASFIESSEFSQAMQSLVFTEEQEIQLFSDLKDELWIDYLNNLFSNDTAILPCS
jgi:hypothetical protein